MKTFKIYVPVDSLHNALEIIVKAVEDCSTNPQISYRWSLRDKALSS